MRAGFAAFAITLAVVACELTFDCRSYAEEDPVTVLAKANASIAGRANDQQKCAEVVERAPSRDYPEGDGSFLVPNGSAAGEGGVPAVAGVAIAGLIFGLIELGRAEDRAQSLCMRNLGYVELPLTPDEAATYKKLSLRDRAGWEATFLSSDLEARVKAVVTPKVPRLPGYRDEPMEQGGLKIEAETLVLAASQIDETGNVVTGTAIRSRTATLITPLETKDGPVRIAADAGTVFHQVDYRPQSEPLLRTDGATWCGPVRQMSGGNVAKDFYCFTGFDDGYRIYRPTGQAWMAGPYADGFMLPSYTSEIKLEEREQDDLGPLDFSIAVNEINHRSVDLAAYVKHAGKRVLVFKRRVEFATNGQAILPLWTMRLILTRTAHGGVTAELKQDGDGKGWRAGG